MRLSNHCLTLSNNFQFHGWKLSDSGSCQTVSGSCQTLSNNFQFNGWKLSERKWKLSDSKWNFSVSVLTTLSREEGRGISVLQGKEEGDGTEGRGGIA